MKIRALALLAAPLLASCASGGPGPESAPVESRRASGSAAITHDQVLDARLADAYAIVQRLRPAWLRRRGQEVPNAAQDVVVYVDGNPRGYAPALRAISASSIYEIRFVDPLSAKVRYGPGHDHGVILVVTDRS